jgi:hypothetical protein
MTFVSDVEKLKDSTESICSLGREGQCVSSKEINEEVESFENKVESLQCTGNINEKTLCVLKKLNKENIIIKYFKPSTKSFSHNHWLNNTEIDTVQYQFMTNYKGYYYSDIHMIDFGMFSPSNKNHMEYDTVPIKDIDFVSELDNKGVLTSNGPLKNYGMVVNTDTSEGGGIHWFSIFIDFSSSPITIEYFNSSGFDIKNKEFKKFFVDLADTISLKKRECKFIKVSDIQHQNSSTSNCGVYALYYIWKRLGGESIEFFKKNKIDDDHIVLFRKYFFTSKG